MKSITKIQSAITIGAVLLIVGHILFPNINIDFVTVSLLITAILPWLAPLFKNIEFPGGWKFEFQKLEDQIKEAGLSESQPPKLLATEPSPRLELAKLRIDIEKSLQDLAQRKGSSIRKGSVMHMAKQLRDFGILSGQEVMVLADLAGILNKAVHSEDLPLSAYEWATSLGYMVVNNINSK